jgi:KTSC domain-containing protein
MATTKRKFSSSFLVEAAYNHRNKRMDVKIQNRPTTPVTEYLLHGVPADVADGLFSAPSVGQYFNKNIRGKYKTYKRVK